MIISFIRKIVLFLRSVLYNIVNNKMRFFLSVLGITVSGIFIIYGVGILDSYYNGKMELLDSYSEEGFAAIVEENSIIDFSNTYVPDCKIKYTDNENSIFSYDFKDKEQSLYVFANFIGMSNSSDNVIAINEYDVHLIKANLISGRMIDNYDEKKENKVIVIDELTAGLLFDGEEAIGKTTKINTGNNTIEVEVVGVIKNNYFTNQSIDEMKRSINKEDLGLSCCYSSVYLPLSVLEKYILSDEDEETLGKVVYTWDELEIDKDSMKDNLNYITSGNVSFVDYEEEQEKILDAVGMFSKLFLIVYIVIFCFSGLNSMNIFFFNVKERISEIGIRKTYGANGVTIAFELIVESIIIVLFAYVISAVVATNLVINSVPLAKEFFGINIVYKFKKYTYLFPLFTLLFQGLFFSLIPSIYASKIKIVDALRFE